MKKLLSIVISLVLLALLVGCGGSNGGDRSDSPIVGVWERSERMVGGTRHWMYEFNADGTLTITANGNADTAGRGTWRLTDNRLYLSRDGDRGAWPADTSFTIRFPDDDTVVLRAWGDDTTLTRVE